MVRAMTDSVETEDQAVESAREIVSHAMKDATFDDLVKKPRRVSSFSVSVPNDDGSVSPRRLRFRAISPKEYDELLAAHPPTPKQKNDGAFYNPDTFPPALIAAVSYVPKLTVAQATELYHHPDWSPGETGELFMQAGNVCNAGLSVPFSAGD